jgi:NADH-quinone oxidoreductase subunit L
MNHLAVLVLLLPLVGFFFNGLLRHHVSKAVSGIVGCGVILAAFTGSLFLFNEVRNGHNINLHLFEFIQVGAIHIPFAFQIDQLSSLFLLVITGVGFFIHLYSTAYMHEESNSHFARYFAYLNLFIFSMLLLVMGANYVIMFIGWEGVGLCSYLLIGYWFKNTVYNAAAQKAFVMNRIGDLGFLLAIFWLVSKTGTVSFIEVFNSVNKLNTTDITIITLLFFVAATGKSAQIPLYTWLPDAMAGPTPVSALIHAATMVTAGIYLIARSNILYSLAPITQNIITIVGLATALLAATIALKQNDIKKVLAYSTVSQLGYMFLGLGVGAYTGAVFHVITHAFFKALLFLAAGSVIHALHHEQDMRNMGGLKKRLPITHFTFLIGCIAIAGIPPLSGFFSKDEILAAVYAKSPLLWVLAVAGACLTSFYMFRLYATTFLGHFRGTPEQDHHLKESPLAITIPLIVLALLSAAAGFIGIPSIFATHGHHLANFLSPLINPSNTSIELSHATEYMLMGVSVALALLAMALAVSWFPKRPDLKAPTGLGKVLANKWYVDELYQAIIIKPIHAFSKLLDTVIEKLAIDGVVNGIGKLVQTGSRQLRLLQSGLVGSYVLLMIVGILALLVLQFFVKK